MLGIVPRQLQVFRPSFIKKVYGIRLLRERASHLKEPNDDDDDKDDDDDDDDDDYDDYDGKRTLP